MDNDGTENPRLRYINIYVTILIDLNHIKNILKQTFIKKIGEKSEKFLKLGKLSLNFDELAFFLPAVHQENAEI